MMHVFYLSTCDTCKRILNELGIEKTNSNVQDIKTNPVTNDQFDKMAQLIDSPIDLINKRARKLKALNLSDQDFTLKKVKELVTTEYTFLKRPVFLFENRIFTGNSKKTIEALKTFLSE